MKTRCSTRAAKSPKISIFQRLMLTLMAPLLWGHCAHSIAPDDNVLARMALASYRLHEAKSYTSWNMIPIQDEDSVYGAIFYPKAPGGRESVIALKGTETGSDWLTNSMLGLTLCRGCGEARNLYVHQGYYIRAKTILPLINKAIKPLGLDQHRVTFTGHSLGGAVVSILSLLNVELRSTSSYDSLVTFGAPQAGDAATVSRINSLFGNRQAHYRFYSDLVPMAFPFFEALTYIFMEEDADEGEATNDPSYEPYSYSLLLSPPSESTAHTHHSMHDYVKALKTLKQKRVRDL